MRAIRNYFKLLCLNSLKHVTTVFKIPGTLGTVTELAFDPLLMCFADLHVFLVRRHKIMGIFQILHGKVTERIT